MVRVQGEVRRNREGVKGTGQSDEGVRSVTVPDAKAVMIRGTWWKVKLVVG